MNSEYMNRWLEDNGISLDAIDTQLFMHGIRVLRSDVTSITLPLIYIKNSLCVPAVYTLMTNTLCMLFGLKGGNYAKNRNH